MIRLKEHPSQDTFFTYLDKSMSSAENEVLAVHLESCQDCQKRFNEVRRLFEIIASVPEIQLNRDLSPLVMAHLQPLASPRFLSAAVFLQFLASVVILAFAIPVLLQHPSLAEVLHHVDAFLQGIPSVADLLSEWFLPLAVDVESFFVSAANGLTQTDRLITDILSVIPLVISSSLLWLVGNGILIRRTANRSS